MARRFFWQGGLLRGLKFSVHARRGGFKFESVAFPVATNQFLWGLPQRGGNGYRRSDASQTGNCSYAWGIDGQLVREVHAYRAMDKKLPFDSCQSCRSRERPQHPDAGGPFQFRSSRLRPTSKVVPATQRNVCEAARQPQGTVSSLPIKQGHAGASAPSAGVPAPSSTSPAEWKQGYFMNPKACEA